ncbi:MAG: site-specific integrase, partial [Chloroflexota bacterium]|nr:site-specific integrase [Chloroflexota bacterium]
GADPQAERQREAIGFSTAKELMDKWVTEYAQAHRRGWKEDQRRVNRRIVPKLGKLRLEDLTPDVLATWHRRMGQNSPVEANRCLETLRAAWRWAEREGLLAPGLTNPAMRVKRYRERSRDRWLRTEEVARLMESVAKEKDPYVTAAIPLLLLTGLRKGELLGAKWADVDLKRGEIRLPMTKTGEAQVRILIEPAVKILRTLPRMQESPYVFPRAADPAKPRDDIKKPWDRIRKRAGLAEVSLHDLRRTAGSVMAQHGISLEVIGKVLGHSHPSVTKLYARLSSQNEREALNTVADALGGALGLSRARHPSEGLPKRLRALLKAAEKDPEALAAGLRDLVDWNGAVEA